MFKKFKDKLAEEVKSSPQRIQQFAQAAQAAVTSASSSITDITNNDLFSIGDNDSSGKVKNTGTTHQNSFKEVSFVSQSENAPTSNETDFQIHKEMSHENQRQRRLSNSSFASDISFRLPSYESPSMYHLQSDMEVSASEAEEKGFSGSTVNLDRVTKDQLYAAYRRTQVRCTKYKTQYADLARHYKLLERENAKAKNVLVETQDKALRRISELREQCALEQSAKAHLEKALRLDIEEKIMKIHTLDTKLNLLQHGTVNDSVDNSKVANDTNDNDTPLITLALDEATTDKKTNDESTNVEGAILNNKIEKMEQLLNKYKDSLKITKEKNAQLTTELQIVSSELEAKIKENDQLKAATVSLTEARQKLQDLNETIEELQNKNNSYEFLKRKELSILELNLQNAKDEIKELCKKIEILSKREEEYAISLAENKLSIHKELESKESEIKSLKDSLESSRSEIQSLNIILDDYKNDISHLNEENHKLKQEFNEVNVEFVKMDELKKDISSQTQKIYVLEQLKNKTEEEYNCLKLQLEQEIAEKLAMIDRNAYLENRNSQILEDNSKRCSQINLLEKEMQLLKEEINNLKSNELDETSKKYIEEITTWKTKCNSLESEIQEERVELVKLQSEIEKLLENYDLVQKRDEQLSITVEDLISDNTVLRNKLSQTNGIKKTCVDLKKKISILRKVLNVTQEDTKSFKQNITTILKDVNENLILSNVWYNKETALKEKLTKELNLANISLQGEVDKLTNENKLMYKNVTELHEEIDKLNAETNELNSENKIQVHKISKLDNDHRATFFELDTLKKSFEELNKKLQAYKLEIQNNVEHINKLKSENNELRIIVQNTERDKESLKTELSSLFDKNNDILGKLQTLTKEQEELLILKEDNKKKTDQILELQKCIEKLNDENASQKKISQTISVSVKDIELELKEVRKSHTQIELEKEHLNSIINKLENKATEDKMLCTKVSQTDFDKVEDNEIKNLKKELQLLADLNNKLTEENQHNKNLLVELNEMSKHHVLLKEENKRLQSEIESLQHYMTKVSKENSQLNDKLREMLSSTEGFAEKNMESLKLEIQTGKDKIESLVRENSLLAEENLELKDQIVSTNYSHTINANESNNLGNEHLLEKYNNLLNTNNELQKNLDELMSTNDRINGNMQQIQTNNEKLTLSNEKLERRLDEALVSLRHLHSLQENTELEYLRNILYEYLTGSGSHSITLAKVLSAVVKFDDRQTETVLQKEKERQSLLRQLGII